MLFSAVSAPICILIDSVGGSLFSKPSPAFIICRLFLADFLMHFVSWQFLPCLCTPSLPWLATVWTFPLELREGQGVWMNSYLLQARSGSGVGRENMEMICAGTRRALPWFTPAPTSLRLPGSPQGFHSYFSWVGGRWGRSYLLRCCHQGGIKWGRILWGDLPMRKHREREQEAGKTMKLPGESAPRWRGKAGRQMPGGHWLWRGAYLWEPPPRSCPAEGFVFPRSVCASEPFSALSLVRSSLQNHSVSTDLCLTFWQWFRYIKEYIYPRMHNGYIYIFFYITECIYM